jgi:hypothetical protein
LEEGLVRWCIFCAQTRQRFAAILAVWLRVGADIKTGVDVVKLGIDVVPSSVLKCLLYCGGT